MSKEISRAFVTAALLLMTAIASAQTVTKEAAAAQGRAMGAAYNAGAGLLNSGIGAIGSAIKGAVSGSQETTTADVQVNAAQGATAVLAAMNPSRPAKSSPDGLDEQYARTPRASFEAAVDKAIAMIPEDRRTDVKAKAMADYDARVGRFNANVTMMNSALPIALDSVNVALKVQ